MSSSRSASITERVETPLGPLPRDWKVQFLDEICEINPESFDADDHEDDAFEYITLSNAEHGSVRSSDTVRCDDAPSRARRLVRDGDVLVGTVRPNQRSHGFVSEEYDEAVCSTGFGVLRTKDGVNSQFLIQEVLSRRFFRQMSAYVAGSGYPAVKLSDLDRHRITVPPLEEQRKIASVLYTVDELAKVVQREIKRKRRLFNGILESLLRRGTGGGRIVDPETIEIGEGGINTDIDRTSVDAHPESWEVARLDSLVTESRYGAAESAEDYDPKKPRYIRITDISGDGRLKPEDPASLSREKAGKHRVTHNDLLFARSGATAGKTYLCGEQDEGAAYGGYLIRFRPQEDAVLPRYLFYYTQSRRYNRWVERVTRKGAQANINAREYGSLAIPLPPMKEQREIVEILDLIRRRIGVGLDLSDRLSVLNRGLMQDLLTGEVRTKDVDIEIPDDVAAYG